MLSGQYTSLAFINKSTLLPTCSQQLTAVYLCSNFSFQVCLVFPMVFVQFPLSVICFIDRYDLLRYEMLF